MKCECCGKEIEAVKHEWIDLPNCSIGKYCITNAQYKEFIDKTGHKAPSHWNNSEIPAGKENHPVVYVSYWEANIFCAWLSNEINEEVDLPTEDQWTSAAGPSKYPWGDQFDKDKCNSLETNKRDTVPVDAFPEGDSPCGCSNMAGNVWEWVKENQK